MCKYSIFIPFMQAKRYINFGPRYVSTRRRRPIRPIKYHTEIIILRNGVDLPKSGCPSFCTLTGPQTDFIICPNWTDRSTLIWFIQSLFEFLWQELAKEPYKSMKFIILQVNANKYWNWKSLKSEDFIVWPPRCNSSGGRNNI